MWRAFAVVVLVAAEPLGAPLATAEQEAKSAQELIAEGVALHDLGRFQEAVAKYREALTLEPDNDEARYELAFSLFGSRLFDECIDVAERGLPVESPLRGALYSIAGNCLDSAGKTRRALTMYEEGLQFAPDSPDLNFNLAVTLGREGELARALEHAKKAALGRSAWASTHYQVAELYRLLGYRLPAVLAAFYFLSQEPESDRSHEMAWTLVSLFERGVTRESANEVHIAVDTEAPKSEGDFSAEELMMQAAVAKWYTEEGESKSQAENLYEAVDSLAAFLSEGPLKPPADPLITFYVRWLTALSKDGLLRPTLYLGVSSLKYPGIDDWLAAHPEELERLRASPD